jgi:hypothetical protein
MRKAIEHELIVHGVEHAQYFQGCGLSFTSFDDVATGIGGDAAEALEDALESLAEGDWEVDEDAIRAELPAEKIIGVTVLPEDAHDEMWVYVSVRVKG